MVLSQTSRFAVVQAGGVAADEAMAREPKPQAKSTATRTNARAMMTPLAVRCRLTRMPGRRITHLLCALGAGRQGCYGDSTSCTINGRGASCAFSLRVLVCHEVVKNKSSVLL